MALALTWRLNKQWQRENYKLQEIAGEYAGKTMLQL